MGWFASHCGPWQCGRGERGVWGRSEGWLCLRLVGRVVVVGYRVDMQLWYQADEVPRHVEGDNIKVGELGRGVWVALKKRVCVCMDVGGWVCVVYRGEVGWMRVTESRCECERSASTVVWGKMGTRMSCSKGCA